GGGGDARRPDAVAAHPDRLLGAQLVQIGRTHGLRVLRAELEDVADLDHRLDRQHAAAVGTGIAGLDLVQIGEGRLVVAPGLDAGEMPARAVGARDPRALTQRLVGHDAADRAFADADRPDRAGLGAEGRLDLLGRGGARGLL